MEIRAHAMEVGVIHQQGNNLRNLVLNDLWAACNPIELICPTLAPLLLAVTDAAPILLGSGAGKSNNADHYLEFKAKQI